MYEVSISLIVMHAIVALVKNASQERTLSKDIDK